MESKHLTSRRINCNLFRQYEAVMLPDGTSEVINSLSELLQNCDAMIVTTPTVDRLYGRNIFEGLTARRSGLHYFSMPCNEQKKSIEQVTEICEAFNRAGLGRTSVLVGIGGGVCTDLVSMAASIIRRGIPYIRVPTTLIGLVDASVGIKAGINFAGRKSYLGCFHPPRAVLLAPQFLCTLPDRAVRCGVAEIMKMAIICDPELFRILETHWKSFISIGDSSTTSYLNHLIWQATLRMLEHLEQNIYEDRSYEREVDLAHTFSPLIESESNFEIHHGEAVAIDLALSSVLAVRMQILDSASLQRILGLIEEVGLPTWSPLLTYSLCRRALKEASALRGGSPNLILPSKIGATLTIRDGTQLSESLLRGALADLEARASYRPTPASVTHV